MGLLERLGRHPEKRWGPEHLTQLRAKLLDDLRQGFITEHYNGDSGEESLLRSEVYCVVLRRRGRYFLIRDIRQHTPREERLLRVEEYYSVEEMTDWKNAQRCASFKKDGKVDAYRGHKWTTDREQTWTRLGIKPSQAASLLSAVQKAKVELRATQTHFENELARAQKYKRLVVRQPRLEQSGVKQAQ